MRSPLALKRRLSRRKSRSASQGGQCVVLTVEVVGAKNLQHADSGAPDSFCELRALSSSMEQISKVQKTKVVKNTDSPTWHETFVFGGGKQPLEQGDSLEVQIRRGNGKLLGQARPLGRRRATHRPRGARGARTSPGELADLVWGPTGGENLT